MTDNWPPAIIKKNKKQSRIRDLVNWGYKSNLLHKPVIPASAEGSIKARDFHRFRNGMKYPFVVRFLHYDRNDSVGGWWHNVQKQVINTAHGLFDPAGKSINEWGRLSSLLLVKDNCRCGLLRDGRDDKWGGFCIGELQAAIKPQRGLGILISFSPGCTRCYLC